MATNHVTRVVLDLPGFRNPGSVFWNLPAPRLYEEATRRDEGLIADSGALVVHTGRYTGRSPEDKFIVREPAGSERVWWSKNNSFAPEAFDRLRARMLAYLQDRDLFVQDLYVCADPAYRVPLRVVTDSAWQSLFARNLFLRPDVSELSAAEPEVTVLALPGFKAVPELDATRSEAFIVLDLSRKMILIGGTPYAGEIKKSVFTLLNYLLPVQGVLSMHCSANVGAGGDVALFFGLSGTGKTSLSADPDRTLIGDDEHGWSDHGVFNFEGGCYAKMIRLSPTAEPDIYQATHRFGALLENVAVDFVSRRVDLDDDSLTENTRAAYPLEFNRRALAGGAAGHADNVIFLTADAFGVMPPIARLTPAQAMFHFLSGYTSKLAGTEQGVVEPEATFSACFAAPFLVLHPSTYAGMLGQRIESHGARVWLVNTGWTGGPYGTGSRIKIELTRAMVRAVLDGALEDVSTRTDPIFGLEVPVTVPGVPDRLLRPRDTWSDPKAYDRTAKMLAEKFKANFKQFEDQVPANVKAAGPK